MNSNPSQTVPCPVCSAQIIFNVNMLLQGAKFTCANCGGVVSLANESKDIVKGTMEKFEEMKNKVLNEKQENPTS